MVLTKDEFKNILKQIQQIYQKQDKFCSCLEDIVEDSIIPAFIFDQPMNVILKLLKCMFEDENDDIGYFLFELDGVNCSDENMNIPLDKCPMTNNIPLYTDVSSLYDYLISNMNK